MHLTPPVAVEVEAAGPGIERAVYTERAVRFASELGIGIVHEINSRGGVLIIMRETEREITGRLPIRSDRVVLERLIAKLAGAGRIESARVDRGIVESQLGRRHAGAAIRRTHGRVVVG